MNFDFEISRVINLPEYFCQTGCSFFFLEHTISLSIKTDVFIFIEVLLSFCAKGENNIKGQICTEECLCLKCLIFVLIINFNLFFLSLSFRIIAITFFIILNFRLQISAKQSSR